MYNAKWHYKFQVNTDTLYMTASSRLDHLVACAATIIRKVQLDPTYNNLYNNK